ncbi:ANK1, partial [Symbiodinium sp. CCMP2456]
AEPRAGRLHGDRVLGRNAPPSDGWPDRWLGGAILDTRPPGRAVWALGVPSSALRDAQSIWLRWTIKALRVFGRVLVCWFRRQ